MTINWFLNYVGSLIKDMGRKHPYFSKSTNSSELELSRDSYIGCPVSLTFVLDIGNEIDVKVKKVYDSLFFKSVLIDVKKVVWDAITYDEEGKPYLSETVKEHEIRKAKEIIEIAIHVFNMQVTEFELLSKQFSSKGSDSDLKYVSVLINDYVTKLLKIIPKLENLFIFFEGK